MLTLESLNSFAVSRMGKLCALFLAILFAALIIYELFSLAEFYTQINKELVTKNEQTPIKLRPQNNRAIIDAHVFGQSPVIDEDDIKNTLLNIKLVGILLATPDKYSQAIVELENGKHKVLVLGSKIPGGGTLKKILDDGILIERNGVVERLNMEKEQLQFEPLSDKLIMEKE